MARVAGGEGSSLPPGSSWDTPRPAAGRADQTLFLTACLLSRVGVCELKHRSRQGPLTRGSPGENTGVGRHALLQGVLPTQGLKPRRICASRRAFTDEPLGKGGEGSTVQPTFAFLSSCVSTARHEDPHVNTEKAETSPGASYRHRPPPGRHARGPCSLSEYLS